MKRKIRSENPLNWLFWQRINCWRCRSGSCSPNADCTSSFNELIPSALAACSCVQCLCTVQSQLQWWNKRRVRCDMNIEWSELPQPNNQITSHSIILKFQSKHQPRRFGLLNAHGAKAFKNQDPIEHSSSLSLRCIFDAHIQLCCHIVCH